MQNLRSYRNQQFVLWSLLSVCTKYGRAMVSDLWLSSGLETTTLSILWHH